MVAAPIGGQLADRHGPMRVAMVALAAVIPLTVVYGHITVPIRSYGLLRIRGGGR